MKVIEETIKFRGASSNLIESVVTRPTKPRASVILLHGLVVDRDEFGGFYVDLATALAKSGLAAYRFDFAGHGRRANEIADFSIQRQIGDASGLVDSINQESGDLRPNIYLIGASFGAPPAIFLACRHADQTPKISLISPVLDYVATFLDPVVEWGQEIFGRAKITQSRKKAFVSVEGSFELPISLFEEMELIDPMHKLTEYGGRTLIIHGSQDSMVPIGPVHAVTRMSDNVQLNEYPNMHHGPVDADDETGDSPASARLKSLLIGDIVRFFE